MSDAKKAIDFSDFLKNNLGISQAPFEAVLNYEYALLALCTKFMQKVVTGYTQSLDDFSALTEQELHKILVEWNDKNVNYPKHLCIYQLFEAQVDKL